MIAARAATRTTSMVARRGFHTTRPRMSSPYHYPEGPYSNLPFNPRSKYFGAGYWTFMTVGFFAPFGIAGESRAAPPCVAIFGYTVRLTCNSSLPDLQVPVNYWSDSKYRYDLDAGRRTVRVASCWNGVNSSNRREANRSHICNKKTCFVPNLLCDHFGTKNWVDTNLVINRLYILSLSQSINDRGSLYVCPMCHLNVQLHECLFTIISLEAPHNHDASFLRRCSCSPSLRVDLRSLSWRIFSNSACMKW